VKEKNGTMSILEFAKVKGNDAALIIAKNRTRRIRNYLQKLGSRHEQKEVYAAVADKLAGRVPVRCSEFDRDAQQGSVVCSSSQLLHSTPSLPNLLKLIFQQMNTYATRIFK
jgi:hypothetical protein